MQNHKQYQVGQRMPGVVYAPEAELRRYVHAGMLTDETLGQAFSKAFEMHRDRKALLALEREYTYGQLHEITDRLAGAFLRLGLKPLDRVIFQIGNSCELIFGFIACIKAGLIPVCTLHAHRELEIGYLAEKSKARMHFVQGDDPKFDDVEFARQMQAATPTMRWVLQARGEVHPGITHLDELMTSISLEDARKLLQELELDPFQVTVFQLSGGTTGVPKIIPRFHNEYVYTMRAVAAFNDYQPNDVLFMPLPMMHNLNMSCCFGPMLLSGGGVIVASSLTAETLAELFKRFPPSWAVMAGPLVEKLRPSIEAGELNLSGLRGVYSPNNAPTLRKLFKAPVLHIFGMTEGVLMFNQPGDPSIVLDTMVGRPVSELDEVKIFEVGTENEITQPGVEGECAFAGPYTIHGYYESPDRDAEVFTSGGMYRSGDLMSFHDIDGKRYYEFRGRTKDVVSRGGEKINSGEVEGLIHLHPSVNQCAVVGMPDPIYEQKVCAFVILKKDAAPLTVAELGAFLKQQGLAKFKWPERIEVVDEIPQTKAGKADKNTLKGIITRTLAAEKAGTPSQADHMTQQTSKFPISGVHHTARPTWKLAETVRFYRDLLGLPLVHAISARGWGPEDHADFLHFFFDSGNGSTIAFFYYIGTAPPDFVEVRDDYRYRASHTAWRVNTREELLACRAKVEASGVKIDIQVRHEMIESIYFTDPNGYMLEVTWQVRPFETVDCEDASRTLDAAIALEEGSAVTPFKSIDQVWRAKGTELNRLFQQANSQAPADS